MCVSGTGRIQLPQPLFTWFLLYFMLSKRDFRVIKLFPSCPESPSLYSMLSSCMHSHVTTALPAFCAYLPGFSKNPLFSATRCVFWREFPIWDTHFLLDWVLIHPYFQQSNSFRLVECLFSHCMECLHGMCLPWPVAQKEETPHWRSLTMLWQGKQSHRVCKEGEGDCLNSGWGPEKSPLNHAGIRSSNLTI